MTVSIYHTYAVWRIFDVMLVLGTLGLGVCYVIASHLGHVQGWCDISSLVVHLPERIIFRMDTSLLGSLLVASAAPIRDVAVSRFGGKMPTVGALCQASSGIGLILVGSCGPSEYLSVHLVGAFLAFGTQSSSHQQHQIIPN